MLAISGGKDLLAEMNASGRLRFGGPIGSIPAAASGCCRRDLSPAVGLPKRWRPVAGFAKSRSASEGHKQQPQTSATRTLRSAEDPMRLRSRCEAHVTRFQRGAGAARRRPLAHRVPPPSASALELDRAEQRRGSSTADFESERRRRPKLTPARSSSLRVACSPLAWTGAADLKGAACRYGSRRPRISRRVLSDRPGSADLGAASERSEASAGYAERGN
eukprot:scaffold7031_cov254-Pinguiococcus_pyrenoidosus.AAC.12